MIATQNRRQSGPEVTIVALFDAQTEINKKSRKFRLNCSLKSDKDFTKTTSLRNVYGIKVLLLLTCVRSLASELVRGPV
jgi:hypothetical protein